MDPAGPERDMGSWKSVSFTQEQQQLFGVDISGEVVDHEQHALALEALSKGPIKAPTMRARPMPRSAAAALVGGAMVSEVSDEVRALVAKVKADFEQIAQAQGRLGAAATFEPVQVLVQVVAGRNFFVKVRCARNCPQISERLTSPAPSPA